MSYDFNNVLFRSSHDRERKTGTGRKKEKWRKLYRTGNDERYHAICD